MDKDNNEAVDTNELASFFESADNQQLNKKIANHIKAKPSITIKEFEDFWLEEMRLLGGVSS